MATVLLAWELGGGQGHARPLIRLARDLAAYGHQPVLAFKDIAASWSLIKEMDFPLIQAPQWPARRAVGDKPFLATNFADILAIRGWADADDLSPMVRGWDSIFRTVNPKLVIADHSPTMSLAAYGRLPSVLIGTGFTLPPTDEPEFPPLVHDRPPVVPQSRVFEVVRTVQARRGCSAPATLPGLFADGRRYITILPELDPYRDRRREPYSGPRSLLPPLAPLPERPSFFVYLSTESPFSIQVVQALAQSGTHGSGYLHGAGLRPEAFSTASFTLLPSPPPMTAVIPQTTVLVQHGGLNLTQEAMAGGRPQVLLPWHLEHALTARQAESLGVAVLPQSPQAVPAAVKKALDDFALQKRAWEWGEIIQSRGFTDSLADIVDHCRRLLE